MRIVHFSSEHWERARAIRLRALQDAPDAFGSTLEHTMSLTPVHWKERLGSQDAATFVAVVDDSDVGMAVGADYEGEGAGLFGMWVAQEARGTGAGDALVQAVVGWARGKNYERIVLDVGDANEQAIALYARNGFEPTGATCTLPPPRSHIKEHQRALVLRSG